MQMDLFSSLSMMINDHFDDEEEIRELLTVIIDCMPEDQLDYLVYIFKLHFKLAVNELNTEQIVKSKDIIIFERINCSKMLFLHNWKVILKNMKLFLFYFILIMKFYTISNALSYTLYKINI